MPPMPAPPEEGGGCSSTLRILFSSSLSLSCLSAILAWPSITLTWPSTSFCCALSSFSRLSCSCSTSVGPSSSSPSASGSSPTCSMSISAAASISSAVASASLRLLRLARRLKNPLMPPPPPPSSSAAMSAAMSSMRFSLEVGRSKNLASLRWYVSITHRRSTRFRPGRSSSLASLYLNTLSGASSTSSSSSSSGFSPFQMRSWRRTRLSGMWSGYATRLNTVRHLSVIIGTSSVTTETDSEALALTSPKASQMMARRKLNRIMSTKMLKE
mmetsp:Transcript_36468/g.89956  ORF Transcript_36468/g.89956 Transcript_36468/m.89956 type:complete len:271 (+) Transcript_36468:464-1276(+)